MNVSSKQTNQLEYEMAKQMTFMMACREFFGLHAGQTNMQFAQEIKALTDADKAEITAGLVQNGYEIVAVPASK
jgi:hypothetical protein